MFLLSICIPTYNRAVYLKASLETLVVQNRFDEIEVIVSDNASTDETESVVRKFQEQFGNIVYFKNEKNVRDKNFPLVLMRATGVFRKLCNDTILYQDGTVSYMLDIVSKNLTEKPVLFFLNGSSSVENEDSVCTTLDDFVNTVSYVSTWIGGFGLWEHECEKLSDSFSLCDSQLWQTHMLLARFRESKKAYVSNKTIFKINVVSNKDMSYGLFKIFHENYLNILLGYVESGMLSEKCFSYAKKDVLYRHFCSLLIPWELERKKAKYGDEDLKKLVFDSYKSEPYFPDFLKFYDEKTRKQIWKMRKINFLAGVKKTVSGSVLGKWLFYFKRKLRISFY